MAQKQLPAPLADPLKDRPLTPPLVLLATGIIVTLLVVCAEALLTQVPTNVQSMFDVPLYLLLIVDSWLVVIGVIWLLVLTILKATVALRAPGRPLAKPTRTTLVFSWIDTALLAGLGVACFFIYQCEAAIIDALLFGLVITIIWYIVRTKRGQ